MLRKITARKNQKDEVLDLSEYDFIHIEFDQNNSLQIRRSNKGVTVRNPGSGLEGSITIQPVASNVIKISPGD